MAVQPAGERIVMRAQETSINRHFLREGWLMALLVLLPLVVGVVAALLRIGASPCGIHDKGLAPDLLQIRRLTLGAVIVKMNEKGVCKHVSAAMGSVANSSRVDGKSALRGATPN